MSDGGQLTIRVVRLNKNFNYGDVNVSKIVLLFLSFWPKNRQESNTRAKSPQSND
jgi:hypothetical protein